MMRARLFKKAYRSQWHLSNQKEAFIKLLLEGWGFKVKVIGLGALKDKYIDRYGSAPDFEVYDPYEDFLICYIEVTGGNSNITQLSKRWITLNKFTKYYDYARHAPVYFVFLGFNKGKLEVAEYTDYESLYPYAENPECIKKIVVKPNAPEEIFIETPAKIWHPIKELYYELSKAR